MILFDIFNFKTKFTELFNAQNMAVLKAYIKEQIIAQIKKNIPGQEKMDAVVDAVIAFINKHLHSDNKLVQWVIDTFIIQNIRPICQTIYEDLKEIIKGL